MRAVSEEQTALREMTRYFLRREIIPFAPKRDRSTTVPLATVRKIGALGLFGVWVLGEGWGTAAQISPPTSWLLRSWFWELQKRRC